MSEFVEYLREIFEGLGPITTRRMFGGHMIYHQGLPIGLVSDETLYLKADQVSAPIFEALGLTRFSYEKGEKLVLLPYFQAPEAVLEDREEARVWGKCAYEAALRADKTKSNRSKSK